MLRAKGFFGMAEKMVPRIREDDKKVEGLTKKGWQRIMRVMFRKRAGSG